MALPCSITRDSPGPTTRFRTWAPLEESHAPIFNSGLIAGGALCFAFALGFPLFLKKSRLATAGTAAFALDAVALTAIGIFPGDFAPQTHMHYCVSLAFFVLLPVSAFLLAGALRESGRAWLAALTIMLAIVAGGVWIAHFTLFPFGKDVAIPEIISAAAAGLWAVIVGISMLRASDE